MTRGRASSYGTFIGALSLAAVVASLYLSPLGTSPDHKKAAAESDSRVTSVSRTLARRAAGEEHAKAGSALDEGHFARQDTDADTAR